MFRILLLAGLAVRLWSQTADFYVAPNGSDGNPGTLAAPFATIDHARAAVRVLDQNSPGRTAPITALIRAGAYYLAAPLTFTAADSGTRLSPSYMAATRARRP